VTSQLEDLKLTSIAQLVFVSSPGIPANVALELAVTGAWLHEMRSRLIDRFIPGWELLWETSMQDTDPVLIGARRPFRRTDAERVVLTYTHGYSSDRERLVVCAPSIVARWLTTSEKRWNFIPATVETSTWHSADTLAVAAELWEPDDASSPYNALSAAALAAQQLD
jgi:hypothetical protein